MQVDARGKGVITAAQAASFLKQSGLKESVLSQVSSLHLRWLVGISKMHLSELFTFTVFDFLCLVMTSCQLCVFVSFMNTDLGFGWSWWERLSWQAGFLCFAQTRCSCSEWQGSEPC